MTEQLVRISTELRTRARGLGWRAKPDPEFRHMIRLSRPGAFRRSTLEQTLDFIEDRERDQARRAVPQAAERESKK
jgi:hypothetical protein